MENLTDPSHLPFSHHTVLGNRCAHMLSAVACFNAMKHNFVSQLFLSGCSVFDHVFTVEECQVPLWKSVRVLWCAS